MKIGGKNRKILVLGLVCCLGAAAFAGCGKKETGNGAGDGEELKEYQVEEVGTFYLPDLRFSSVLSWIFSIPSRMN